MAGEGSRFLKEGYNIPKPLIQFKDKSLFQRAINSTNKITGDKKYSFIVRQDHIENYQIDKELKLFYPKAQVFSVKETTRGAVETCMKALCAIDNEDAILILDCDLEFKSREFDQSISNILNKPINKVNGGMLVSFYADLPIYSYAEIDETTRIVKRTAEKKVISNHALCGAYFFSKAESFLFATHQLLNDKDFNKPEFYVSLLFNTLIKRGETVKLAQTDTYFSYGTPEELKKNLQV